MYKLNVDYIFRGCPSFSNRRHRHAVLLRRGSRQLPHHHWANPEKHQNPRQHELQIQRLVLTPLIRYNYYIVKDGTILFVCLADSTLKIKSAVGFLEEIKKRFKEKYSAEEINSAGAFDMNISFSEIYKQQFVRIILDRHFTIIIKTLIKRKN